ncbi:hypothetical protein [Chryseobacterium luteum]|uniref:hypothetical protein n=1 Tax=Chryseobacterium luteum TaxID=421531 RepID=UPI00068D4392|nr:hypothetical protein [Chryseobacterium luteum]
MDRPDKDTEAAIPDTHNQGAAQHNDGLKEANSQKMEEKRAENEKKDSTSEDLLLAIHGAKIKFNAHLGEFKVLNDVPTTQGKLTGTIVEKQIPNFTFYDGFQMISLTEWQDFGTAKVQDNYVLLKKSTLPGTGKMPGNIPPETGKIEFVTSGQVNEPESIDTQGAPVVEDEKKIKIKAKQASHTVVLDKNGSLLSGFPILEFEIEDGIPNNLIDIQVVKENQGLLTHTIGIGNSWDKTRLPKDRVMVKTFSSYTNGDRILKLDGSGKATYKMPLDWWRDLARQPLSQFTTMKIYFKVLSFQNSSAVKEESLVSDAEVSNNLQSLQIIINRYINEGGIEKKHFELNFTVKEANTTEMYTFVQWKKGGREIWDGAKRMSRPNVTDYNQTHTSDYPAWTLDRLRMNPRYADGVYSISNGGKTATLMDKPSSSTANSTAPWTFTHIDFESRIHLDFDVPANLVVVNIAGGNIKGIIPPPEPLILSSQTWNTRILQIWDSVRSRVIVSHPNNYTGP